MSYILTLIFLYLLLLVSSFSGIIYGIITKEYGFLLASIITFSLALYPIIKIAFFTEDEDNT
jgi:hypothetical protein